MKRINRFLYIGISLLVLFVGETVFIQVKSLTACDHEPFIGCVYSDEIKLETAKVTYVEYDVPTTINSSFKTYMDYRTVTNQNSKQYELIHNWGWSDDEGFMRCAGERDYDIWDDYYFIALGSYYGTEIGAKYRITTDMGNVFYGILGDCKSDKHTNLTHQYSFNNDIVEFIVDAKKLNKSVKYHGNANIYMPLNGSVTKIERIDFIYE